MTNNFTPAKAGQQSKRLSKEEYAEKMKAEKRSRISDGGRHRKGDCFRPGKVQSLP